MFVFVLTSSFDGEGESPLGVYATKELAMKAAEYKADQLAWGETKWFSYSEITMELRFGASTFVIREERVLNQLPENYV